MYSELCACGSVVQISSEIGHMYVLHYRPDTELHKYIHVIYVFYPVYTFCLGIGGLQLIIL